MHSIDLPNGSGITLNLVIKNICELEFPYFLFNITGLNKDLTFVLPEFNPSETRYSNFILTNNNLNDNYGGNLNLPIGKYYLNIYEQDTIDNLSIDNTHKIIHNSILNIT